MRQKMGEADRKKTETNAFADFLRRVMPTSSEPASKASPPPPPPQKTRRGTQTDVTSASVTTSPLPVLPSTSKEFKYEPPKQERVDDDEDDYDDNFVEDEARAYGRENVGPVASPYLMLYVYKWRFLDTQYGVRKDGDTFMVGD